MATAVMARGKCVKCGTMWGSRNGDENDSWRVVGKAAHLSPLSADAVVVGRRNRAHLIQQQNRERISA